MDHINLLPLAVLSKILRPRLPVLMFAHGIEVWGEFDGPLKRVFYSRLLKFAVNKVACVSFYTKQRMARNFYLDPTRIHILPNCVTALPELSCEESPSPIILSVTRLDRSEPHKNVDKLIIAVAKLAPGHPQLTLQIVGEGSWRADLEAVAREHGVSHRVTFLGRLSDEELELAYRGATLFALPSTREGFGIAYLEAWRQGLPVVGAAAGAAPEVIQDEVDGLLVDPEHPDSLPAALERLVTDKGLRDRLAAAGRDKVRTKYLYEHFAANLNGILETLGERPAPPSSRQT